MIKHRTGATPRHAPVALSCLLLACLCLLFSCGAVVIDSDLARHEAVDANQPPDAPEDVRQYLAVVDVRYYGFDGRLHQGQVVVHRELVPDIEHIFQVILDTRFPLESVLPIAHPLIQLKGPYGLSPDTNNTSAYVWRPVVGSRSVSLHGLGLAIDLNPRLNPYRKGKTVLPPGATYDSSRPGTLTTDCPVVRAFKGLGWQWGGDWEATGKTDYMHFQKIPTNLNSWVKRYRMR